ncbi:MAG: hypothetical protein ACOZAA_18890 [Pseudomonadota bacterium]
MKAFAIVLRGDGIFLNSEPEPVVGFFATRKVWAQDEAEAVLNAKKSVLKEWQARGFQRENLGEAPRLQVDTVTKLRGLSSIARRIPNRGFIFFPESK